MSLEEELKLIHNSLRKHEYPLKSLIKHVSGNKSKVKSSTLPEMPIFLGDIDSDVVIRRKRNP